MHNVALDLLILLAGIWLVAVTLRPLGLPTVMGELIVGVLVGPAVFGWIEPDEAIQLLAEIGIFFLMFHAGVETQPNEFFAALKRSLGVAIAGAAVPFAVSFAVAQFFGLDLTASVFVGLIIGTATAVVITLKSFKDLGLTDTRVARVVVASCIINDLLTLIFFSLVIGALSGGTFAPLDLVVNLGKVVGFFAVALLLGTFVYPRLTLPFRAEGGKGFTFVLLAAIAAGLFAEAIGLHMILGAYLAGLFFEERVAHPNLVKVVNDRAYGIAYSFLGPIFFISLGFSISFDISASGVAFIALLAVTVIAGQVLSAGGMARRIGMSWREALTVGVGMCGRAEMAFILAALALAQGAIGQETFTILIFTAFLLNLFTPLALKGCSILLEGRVAHGGDTNLGVFQIDKFNTPLVDENLADRGLPAVEDAVVIYGYGPEVETLIEELSSRHLPPVVIEEDEATARQLQTSADVQVVHADLAAETLDLRPLTKAKALVANGSDDDNALFRAQCPRGRFCRSHRGDDRAPPASRPHVAGGRDRSFYPQPRSRCGHCRPGQREDRPSGGGGRAARLAARSGRTARSRPEPAGQPHPGRDRAVHSDRCSHRRAVGGRRARLAAGRCGKAGAWNNSGGSRYARQHSPIKRHGSADYSAGADCGDWLCRCRAEAGRDSPRRGRRSAGRR